MEPAMFSVASMFGSESGDDEEDNNIFQERDHSFPGLSLRIREFTFHHVNANLLWPGASIFAKWLVQHEDLVKGRRTLELGSGTGALAIFLKRIWDVDITTSDFDDEDIENNIKYNCHLNGLNSLPHIRHTWGGAFPHANPDWDLIIASDILLYVKSYPHLIRTLCVLLPSNDAGQDQQSPEQEDCHASTASKVYEDVASLTERNPEVPLLDTSIRRVTVENSAEVLDSEVSSDEFATASCTAKPSIDICSSLSDKPRTQSRPPLNKHLDEIKCLPRPCFVMSWRRRIPRQDEAVFFEGCRIAGLIVSDLGSRVFCIHRPS